MVGFENEKEELFTRIVGQKAPFPLVKNEKGRIEYFGKQGGIYDYIDKLGNKKLIESFISYEIEGPAISTIINLREGLSKSLCSCHDYELLLLVLRYWIFHGLRFPLVREESKNQNQYIRSILNLLKNPKSLMTFYCFQWSVISTEYPVLVSDNNILLLNSLTNPPVVKSWIANRSTPIKDYEFIIIPLSYKKVLIGSSHFLKESKILSKQSTISINDISNLYAKKMVIGSEKEDLFKEVDSSSDSFTKMDDLVNELKSFSIKSGVKNHLTEQTKEKIENTQKNLVAKIEVILNSIG